ncbi:unnamed protein product [Spirodela intermedia]|uniref:Uncharacterized protein n=1 Tax=Spirodela intermedia TaxID=51605 RepID=A0A7I8L229_SPIIN|nr:unnamed protein product [Spirodela intermedia]
MEVLPCPELQCAGESNCPPLSPESKQAGHGVEEKPNFMHVDCFQERSADGLTVVSTARSESVLEVHNTTPLSVSNQLEGKSGSVNGLQVMGAVKRPRIEQSDGTPHDAESVQILGCPLQLERDQILNGDPELKASFPRADSCQIKECNILNNRCHECNPFNAGVSLKEESDRLRSKEFRHLVASVQCKGEHVVEQLKKVSDNFRSETGAQQNQTQENKRMTNDLFPADPVVGSSGLPQNNGSSNLHGLSNHAPTFGSELINLSLGDQVMEETAAQGQSNEPDDPEALWVKWRGKWQTGIRCPRADHPLSTLKAKPTHGRKKYVVVFFPNTRTYSWVDTQLIRSIDELPVPLACGTHYTWMAFVKDLTFQRRYVMQKLAVLMLDISDQLHTQAVIESARRASTWKEFAEEASLCREYFELGMMLLKLHKMILPEYIKSNWLEHSYNSWVTRCEQAQSAETIELLTEELVDSVLWTNVDKLWDAPVQPELGTEWRTWKQEVMKIFFTSLSGASCSIEKLSYDFPSNTGVHFSRKRPKLEVRTLDVYPNEADATAPLAYPSDNRNRFETPIEGVKSSNTQTPDAGSSANGDDKMVVANDHPDNDFPKKYRQCLGFVEAKGRQCGRWANDGEIYCCAHLSSISVAKASQAELTPKFKAPMLEGTSAVSSRMALANYQVDQDSLKYRQCLAFVEAKGRQCGRWANDGDIYCCVHLNNHIVSKPSQADTTPPFKSSMCEGMTTHGKKCKHRARSGSTFCKKHQVRRTDNGMISGSSLTSSESNLKGKYGIEKLPTTSSSCAAQDNEDSLTREAVPSMGEKSVPIAYALDERRFPQNPLEPNDASYFGHCIGHGDAQCLEDASKHALYCERHLPNFLKRARNGKSRLISKEVFVNLLKGCASRKQKIYLHQACELLYSFMKGSLSHQKSISQGDHMGWILSEASKDPNVGGYLLKLVSCEREKISRVCGFDAVKDEQVHSSLIYPTSEMEELERDGGPQSNIKCKICAEGFSDDQILSAHWMEAHKKEAQWLFRGYACAVCRSSFTNRKVQEAHVRERHGTQFLEDSLLFRCMACNSLFSNAGKLWQHVLSCHSMEFRLPDSTKPSQERIGSSKVESHGESCLGNGTSKNEDGSQRYVCRFCGLKFDLLPDLGRHHQSAHMNLSYVGHFSSRKNKHIKYGRHHRSRFNKGLGPTSGFKSSGSLGMKKCVQSSSSVVSSRLREQAQASEVHLGRLLESDCRNVAEALFTEMQKTKSPPSNVEILSIARSTCCRTNLHYVLKKKYGTLPENLYLKAAKLCSEANIPVNWHQEGFTCPKGCNSPGQPYRLSPLIPLACKSEAANTSTSYPVDHGMWAMEECHYVLSPKNFNRRPARKAIILCEDISFGLESVPVPCVVDENIIKEPLSTSSNGSLDWQALGISMPWQGFSYATKRLLDPALGLDTKSSQLGCACSGAKCSPETCDHVYLFDNDYENAKDIDGHSMRGRFPYDEMGRIVVEEGCLIYECNSKCSCDKTCQNRILQNGVQVKLEVFRTDKKGWAVRATEAISRGRFICEYIGEVLNDVEATRRGERYDSEGCSYLYDIDAHIDDDDGRLSEGKMPYVIDATKCGNVARFINHSCSPNLVNYQVLVESMDCQLAHIGLYAGRDILPGEELSYDYRYKLLPGVGCPCHCGAPNCRGRLY